MTLPVGPHERWTQSAVDGLVGQVCDVRLGDEPLVPARVVDGWLVVDAWLDGEGRPCAALEWLESTDDR